MAKKILMLMLLCQGVGLHSSIYANPVNLKDHSFTYASPCEEVKPESDLLSYLSKQLEATPNRSYT
ncbi:hypothetical protein [Acinetobacter sp. B51(2017)]|uniref:hypothetical protein n=1 Tax=Acinetobacter sp. B51(2017) TaxID=2060938 RepID=UPI002076EC63|nr:hypothetical protein [Acinetobacter sp. B51(2017)]